MLGLGVSLWVLGHSQAIGGAGPPMPPASGKLLNAWFFDDTNWLSIRGEAPQAFCGLTAVPSWSGQAVEISGKNALLQYATAGKEGSPNILCHQGTVMFWFRPAWETGGQRGGPGCSGRLIEIGEYPWAADEGWETNGLLGEEWPVMPNPAQRAGKGWWSLHLDEAGTMLFFSGQTNGAGATYLAAPIQWQSNQWHCIALTYSPSNSVLYLDGQLGCPGRGVAYWPGPEVLEASGFRIGGDSAGTNLAGGQFEWLTTFDYPMNAETVRRYFEFALQGSGAEPRPESVVAAGPGSLSAAWAGFTNGPGGLLAGLEGCAPNPLELLTPEYQGTNVVLQFIGNSASHPYDLFYSQDLMVWSCGGRLATNQTVTDFPPTALQTFFVLGTTQDADGDGVTDAFERLISHTDPYTGLVPLEVFLSRPSERFILP